MKKNFTLIELLVVVAIIGILSSMLLPSLGKAREKGRSAVCISNLKQLSICFEMYRDSYDRNLTSWETDRNTHWALRLAQANFLEDYNVVVCPTARVPENNGFGTSAISYKRGTLWGSYGYNNALEMTLGGIEMVDINKISNPARLPVFLEAAWPDAGWHSTSGALPVDFSNPMSEGTGWFQRSCLAIHSLKRGNYVFADGSAGSIDIRSEIKSLLWNYTFD